MGNQILWLCLQVNHNIFKASKTFPISQGTFEFMAWANLDGVCQLLFDLFMNFAEVLVLFKCLVFQIRLRFHSWWNDCKVLKKMFSKNIAIVSLKGNNKLKTPKLEFQSYLALSVIFYQSTTTY